MGEPSFDDNAEFDEKAEAEWQALADRLQSRFATLKREEFVELARTDLGGYRQLFVFTVTGSERVRCTIDGMAFVGFGLREQRPLVRAQRVAVTELGWRQLRSGTLVYEVGRRQIGELVGVVLRVLREVWKIADQSALTVHDPFLSKLGESAETESLLETPEFGVVPRDADHLLEMARRTLSAHSGEVVEVDEKAIRFTTVDGVYTKMLVSPQAMRLEFCTILAHGTPDMDLLGAVVAEHSSRWPDVSIVVTKGHVFGVRAVECAVFHSTNLLAAMDAWLEFCRDAAIDIVEQFHPEEVRHPDLPPEEVPDRLTEMIEKYAQDRSAITPEFIVRSSRANTPMLRRYARICDELIQEWTGMEQFGIAKDYPADEIAKCGRHRDDIEQFMPVLLAAISLAAEANGRWEMRRRA